MQSFTSWLCVNCFRSPVLSSAESAESETESSNGPRAHWGLQPPRAPGSFKDSIFCQKSGEKRHWHPPDVHHPKDCCLRKSSWSAFWPSSPSSSSSIQVLPAQKRVAKIYKNVAFVLQKTFAFVFDSWTLVHMPSSFLTFFETPLLFLCCFFCDLFFLMSLF